jgi:ACS family hexuronate transporter-like MFS transporter
MIVYPAHRLPGTVDDGSTEESAEFYKLRPTSWLEVLSTPGVWLIALCNSLTNPVWFFYLFWFPKYLTDERGLSVAEMGRVAWVVYASAGVGSLVGGALSGWAIKHGATPPKARILVLTLLAMIAPLGALNALAPPVVVSLALGSLVAFCHTAWVTNQSALLVDLYPGPQLAKAFATSGLLAGAVTIGSQYLIGQLVASLTYRPMFLVIAVAYPFGLLAAWLATRAMRRRAWETHPEAPGGR